MKKININITQARIKKFSVQLDEKEPEVTAEISLLTANDKEITTFSIGSGSWRTTHFDLPISMIPPIKDLAAKLEAIVTQEANKALKMLPEATIHEN